MARNLNQKLHVKVCASYAGQSPSDQGIKAICQPFSDEHIGNADDKEAVLVGYASCVSKPSIIIWLVDLQLEFAQSCFPDFLC